MTINVLRGRRSTTSATDGSPAALPIGDDASPDVFSCPGCARPLAVGTARCPGCHTILLAGVPARRAALFLVIGAVFGLLAGATAATVVSGAARATPQASVVAAVPTPTGNGTDPLGSAAIGAPSLAPGIPSAAASALRLTITVDDRLAASTARLRAALRGSFDPVAAAAILRTMAADAAWGTDVVGRLGEWPAAVELQGSLRAHYAAVGAMARDGLSATMTSASAYRVAAERMVALSDRLTPLRSQSVDLAGANGIGLPQN